MIKMSINEIRAEIGLDVASGQFYWLAAKQGRRHPPGQLFCGTSSRSRHRSVVVNGASILSHRLAFALFHGRWPRGELDHINRDPSDNRPENLRECTRQENSWNVDQSPKGASGFRGVHWHAKGKKWVAQYRSAKGKKTYLGSFDTAKEASDAYEQVVRAERSQFLGQTPVLAARAAMAKLQEALGEVAR